MTPSSAQAYRPKKLRQPGQTVLDRTLYTDYADCLIFTSNASNKRKTARWQEKRELVLVPN